MTLQEPPHSALAEQYIWTADDVTAMRRDRSKYPWSKTDLRIDPHYFRAHFKLDKIPEVATLFLAGPRSAAIYLNGKQVGVFSTDLAQPINFRVFHVDVSKLLRTGNNILAVEAVRGRGVVCGTCTLTGQQLAYGEVLVAKINAGAFGDLHAAPLLISNGQWRSSTVIPKDGWSSADYDDHEWASAKSIGAIESNIEFLQWSADAGMYGWPGYVGMSPWLRTFTLRATAVTHIYKGGGALSHVDAISNPVDGEEFTVHMETSAPTDAEAPAMLLDFGKEIAGRILVASDSAQDAVLSIAYGESELEALATGTTPMQRGGNYLGTNLLDVPAQGIARGPKSAFRYVRIRFLRGATDLKLRSIRAEGITYPVHYEGSFDSSDPLLNKIWETAAYTAHLAMQDDIWDAPKRDRGRWAGDLDVEAPTILDAFGDTFLLEDTLRRIAESTTPGKPVNGITSYTAQWLTTVATLYADSGDRNFVVSQRKAILQNLQTMDDGLDATTATLNAHIQGWGFVDWAPGLYGATPQAQLGTALEFLRAYQAVPALLRAMGDETLADHYESVAQTLHHSIAKKLSEDDANSLGSSWQLNTLAVLTGINPQHQGDYSKVFSAVQQSTPYSQVISPYFNAYVLSAMAVTHQQQQALNWMEAYWGGMLAEGATSFWESYDLHWPKTDPHLSLQADGTSGFFVSMAHGWSSAPVAWLDENVLGVRSTSPGYTTVELRPCLLGLKYARGGVATPHGPITISIDANRVMVDLPPGVTSAKLFLPDSPAAAPPLLLKHPGHYMFHTGEKKPEESISSTNRHS